MDDNKTLEMEIKATAGEAVKSIDKIINKLTGIEIKVGDVSKTLNKSKDISNVVQELDKVTSSAKRLSNINLGNFEKQITSIYSSISKLTNSLNVTDASNIESISKLINKMPSSVEKINQVDFKKLDKNFNLLTNAVTPFLDKLKESETSMSNFVEMSKQLNSTATAVNKVEKEVNKVKNTTDKATNSAGKLTKALSVGGAYITGKRIMTTFLDWMDYAVDRTEQLNLFNVVFKNIEKNGKTTFSELGKEATKFQYKLNEKFGTNMTETTKYQGLFQSMAENAGINDYYSSIMSETMTKLTYDLASLYNKSESVTAEAIRAGVYSGQTKPLRGFGIDVTQTSMQPILDKLGITDRSVKQMSQAEKEILRYIATLEQAQVAMGDFANTAESPSNQMKIFKQQLVEVKIAISNLFMGVFSQVLPYANAILMVVKELAKALANILGIKITDFNAGIAINTEAFEDLEDSIDGATGSVKELKRQTLGFDEIHNLDEPKNSGSGSILGGGIDQRLLDAIKGYDNGMESLNMKSKDIASNIMKWLGFTEEVDAETEETSWKFDHITGGTVLGALVVGGTIYTGVSKIFKFFKGIAGFKFSNITGLLDGLKIFGEGSSNGGILATISSALGLGGGATGGLALGAIVIDAAAALVSINGISNLMHSFKDDTEYTLGLFEKIALVVGSMIGGPVSFLAGVGLWSTIKTLVEDVVKSEQFEKMRTSISNLYNTAKEKFDKIYQKVSEVITKINDVVKPVWDTAWELMGTIVGSTLEALELPIKNFLSTISGVCDIIVKLIDGDLSGAFDRFEEMIGDIWNNVKESFENIKNKWSETTSDIVSKVKELPEKMGKWIKETTETIVRKIRETDWKAKGQEILDGIVNGVKDIGSRLADFGTKIKEKLSDAIGKVDWKNLGINILKKIVEGLFAFGNLFKTFADSFISGIKAGLNNNASGMQAAKNARGAIGYYANGGMPSTGELFIAREKGPELIGQMGNKTAVMNNGQIVASVSAGVYEAVASAMSQYGGQASQIELTMHTDEGVVVDRINQRTKQTGVCPINIPY